jgi:hypothetical protein
MKQLFLILAFIGWGCKAQSPVLSLYDDEYKAIIGAYYKDTHNDLDNYIGTWKYTNGTTSLTITLQKKIMKETTDAVNNSYYEDILIGEYQYIENGSVKINTLPQLLLNLSNIYDYNIVGNAIIGPHSFHCSNCGPNDRKMLLGFSDPTCDILGYESKMFFQRIDSGGIQKLKLKFLSTGSMQVEEGVTPPCTEYKIPFGEYILIKQ